MEGRFGTRPEFERKAARKQRDAISRYISVQTPQLTLSLLGKSPRFADTDSGSVGGGFDAESRETRVHVCGTKAWKWNGKREWLWTLRQFSSQTIVIFRYGSV